jgi:DNA (cytosine-5)-methyltransferase 1
MSRKPGEFAVVDLFAGPGGLAEGFSSVVAPDGKRPFKVVLSVEKERAAHSTLLLRTFLRQFKDGFPPEYYSFLNGGTAEPDWEKLYPREWKAANHHALLLELGKKETTKFLYERIDEIHAEYGDNTILIGGPPCQAYSLVGRARNCGVEGYVAEDDPKHFLYEQYILILERLQPAAFVMENVKGMLSSSVNNEGIFAKVLADLRSAGDKGGYRLIALAPPEERRLGLSSREPSPNDFIIRAEDFGLPQARHRVIVTGLRRERLKIDQTHLGSGLLKPCGHRAVIEDVLDGMARLRSGLSHHDSADLWAREMQGAVKTVMSAFSSFPQSEKRRLKERTEECACIFQEESKHLLRSARRPNGIGLKCPSALRQWILDSRLKALPNHETRGHMASDLARYLFAAIYGEVKSVTPKASHFPDVLAPEHKSWASGNFNDRFRVQLQGQPSTTITCHISKDGHYFIHPDPTQCRSLTVREAARLQTFPDNYFIKGNRTEQFIQVGNAVPPFLAKQIGSAVLALLSSRQDVKSQWIHVSPPKKRNTFSSPTRLG